jgi:hypothetical protein
MSQQQAFSGWVLPQSGGGGDIGTVDQGAAGSQAWLVKNVAQLIPYQFDYISMTYVGATDNVGTVTYRAGGPTGSVVATVTLNYDGSGRLTGVTRSS